MQVQCAFAHKQKQKHTYKNRSHKLLAVKECNTMLIMFLHVQQYKDKLRRQPFVFTSTRKGVWLVQFKYCTKMSQNYWGCSRTRYVTPDKHIIKILTQTKKSSLLTEGTPHTNNGRGPNSQHVCLQPVTATASTAFCWSVRVYTGSLSSQPTHLLHQVAMFPRE